MKYNFVTILNNLYLPQALALYESIKKFGLKFKLWAICLDDESYFTILNLGESNFTPVNFKFHENNKLINLRKKRSIAEYCWTITPISPKLIFNLDKNIKFITYVDADIFFLKSPKILINKFVKSKKYISFTRHNFSSDEKIKENIYGKFCVQFMTFKRNKSEKIRKIWETKCIEWCYATPNKGRMGDQKYLDSIYYKFKHLIHISEENAFISTWNYEKINYRRLIAWHFHGFKIIEKNFFLMHHLKFMPIKIINIIYIPYILNIKKIINKIRFSKNQLESSNLFNNIFNKIKFLLIKFKILSRGNYYFINNKLK